jgi:ubiquinol-cytochrome c reductase cytochrome c1 subunit
VELMAGMNYNEYFPGHQIAMPQPLWGEDVEYADGTEATVEQEAKDVTAFLAWAAEPELEDRKSLGIKVLIFLVVLFGLVVATKKAVWRDVKK